MAYIFDIDGTLADCSQRLHFILPNKEDLTGDIDLDKVAPDWESFYKDCVNDEPIMPVIGLAKALKATRQELIFITGRPEKYRAETTEWLCKWLGTDSVFLEMRKDGDHRPDYIVKKELYHEFVAHHFVINGVFEDRKQCVDMWRSLGLTCYQVADGNY